MITYSSECYWSLKLHETYEQSKEKLLIKPYDLCVLSYTLNNAYLSVDPQNSKVILKQLKEEDSLAIPLEAVWEL